MTRAVIFKEKGGATHMKVYAMDNGLKTDYFDLKNKTAVIMGCASEVSKATVCALATAGANVVAVGKDKLAFGPLEKELIQDGHSFEFIEENADSGKDTDTLIDRIIKKHGSINILVNNANCSNRSTITRTADISDKEWNIMVSHGLQNVFYSIRATLPYMLKAGAGKIVNIASFAGRLGFAFNGVHYGVLNAGLTSMVRQLALQYADKGININAIAPGPMEGVDSSMYSSESMELIIKKTPLKRLCRPEEVAAAVLFLSSGVSDYVLGETMNLNCGLYMV
jgi:3-oxoacyl-[acyl-carrier protein] reductase